MGRSRAEVDLTAEEETTLRGWVRKASTERRLVERAKMILLSHEGLTVERIAQQLDTRPARVSKWRQRFVKDRLSALSDAPRPGKPHKYDEGTEDRVLELLKRPPPEGYREWNGSLLAKALGGVSADQVWRILRGRGIELQRQRSWRLTTDSEFRRKAADVVGLYLSGPENALVVCIDEEPHIQVLQRAQGCLRLPDERTVNCLRHGYKRHGTTTLFAALDVVTEEVKTGRYAKRGHREFLNFMDEVVAACPEAELHVILDNLRIHKPAQDSWLKMHPRVHPHFTPNRGSWLNQVECWFSILHRSGLRGGGFTSARELREAIEKFVSVHKQRTAPFEWTKTVVHRRALECGAFLL